MWGFLTGTLALVAWQTLIQPAAADKLAAGSGAFVSVLSRLLSDGVAGLPRTKADKKPASQPGPVTQGWNPQFVTPSQLPNSPGVTTGPQDPTLGGILKP